MRNAGTTTLLRAVRTACNAGADSNSGVRAQLIPHPAFLALAHQQRPRLVLGIFYLQILCTSLADAQRSLMAFGPVIERQLTFSPVCVATAVYSAAAGPDIVALSSETPAFHIFHVGEEGTIVEDDSVLLPRRLVTFVPFRTSPDEAPAYAGLAAPGTSVSVLRRNGAAYDETVYPLPARAQQLQLGDINNDGREDILAFGKTMGGVATLLASEGGRFVAGPILFPGVSVTDLKTVDLNGDGITDVLLLNWLANQLVVFYGISRTVFSEQLSIDLPGEPADLAVAGGERRRMLRVAVTLPEERQVVVLDGQLSGDFGIVARIPCPAPPSGVALTDLNGDGLPDIVTCSEKGTVVVLAASGATFAPPAIYGAAAVKQTWTVAAVAGGKYDDLVAADPVTRRLVVAGNTHAVSPVTWRDAYLVGKSPSGLVAQDVNADGRIDVAVANAGSSTLSLLLNKGEGKFDGPVSFSDAEHPFFVTGLTSSQDEGGTLITSHPRNDRITVVKFSGDLLQRRQFAIPTGPMPHVLIAREDSSTHTLEILVRGKQRPDGSVTLSLFEQLTGSQFLERSLRANLPNMITALTVDDFAGKGNYDLVFVSNDRNAGQSTVSLALAGAGFNFNNVRKLFSYPDSLSGTRAVLSGLIDSDANKDLLIVEGPPKNAFRIALGKGNGTFEDSLLWIDGVQPRDENSIILRDVDGDGHTDITYLDSTRQEVLTLYGFGDGTFSPPRVICPAPGIDAIAIAPLRRPPAQDLVVSSSERSTVSIMYMPFRK